MTAHLDHRPRRRAVALVAGLALALAAACGGGDAAGDAGGDDAEAAPAGIRRDPPPDVSAVALPDAAAAGAAFPTVAEEGGVLLVFFGFTNCPDICPTTLADVRAALGGMGDDAARVDLAMVTVDPGRDTDAVLTDYVRSFVPDGHALRTEDDAALRTAATAFGADYVVEATAGGEVEVGHTSHLYAVDDRGRLVLQWPFGTAAEDIRADLERLLAGDEGATEDGAAGDEGAAEDGAGGDEGAAGEPEVTEAWARSTAAGQGTGAAYLVAVGGAEDDRIVGAAVPPEVAASVEIHETVPADGPAGDAGAVTMREADGIDVPAGATVEVGPGDHHVMLVDLAGPLVAGDSFPLDVTFAGGSTRTVTAEVRDR